MAILVTEISRARPGTPAKLSGRLPGQLWAREEEIQPRSARVLGFQNADALDGGCWEHLPRRRFFSIPLLWGLRLDRDG